MEDRTELNVLLVDAIEERSNSFTRRLVAVGEDVVAVEHARSVEEGRDLLSRGACDLVFLCGMLADDSSDALASVRLLDESVPAVILADSIDDAGMGRLYAGGALHCLVRKELSDPLLRATLRHVRECRRLTSRNRGRLDGREVDIQQAFEHAAAGIVIADAERKLHYANAAFCQMLGCSWKELEGKDFLELTHPDDREPNRDFYGELISGERESFVFEKRFLTREPDAVWSRVSVSLLHKRDGAPTRAVAVTENINQRKLAESRADNMQHVADLAGRMARLGGWQLDLDEGVSRWSDVVCDIHEVPHGTEVLLEDGINFYAPEWRETIANAVQHCIDTNTPFDEELELITARNNRVWVRAMGEAERDENGEVRSLRGAFQDISHLKESERVARQREAAFFDLAEAMPHIVWAATGDGEIDYANSKLGEYCGKPVETALQNGWLNLIHPDDRPAAEESWMSATRSGQHYRTEFRIERHDGECRWHVVQAQPVTGADSGTSRWYGTAIDVHDRRLIEEKAKRLAERLVTTLESVNDAVFTLDTDWCFSFVNSQAEQVLQRSRNALLHHSIWEKYPESVGTIFEKEYRLAVEEREHRNFEAFYPPLESWFSVNAYPTPEGLAVFFRDVTAKRTADQELHISQERFRIVARASNDAIWEYDLIAGEVWWSHGIEDIFGHDLAVLEGRLDAWFERIHPEDRTLVQQSLVDTIESGDESWEEEYRFRRGDGTYAHVADRGFIVRDEDGKPLRMVGGMSDETRHVEAVERLREQADLLDRAQDAITVRDLDHRIVFWSAGAERLYGWSKSEALGASAREMLYVSDVAFEKVTQSVLKNDEWIGEVEHRTQSGETITVEARWSLVRDSDGQPQRFLTINTDITERKKLEAQFLRAQRLESIGTLAGGIAHDLNNVLSPILMSIELLKMDERDPDNLEILDTVEMSARRGAEMVKQVLGFARGVEGARVAVRLQDTISDLSRVIRDTFPKNIVLRTRVPAELWTLRGDPTQIHQVLLNLSVNARDAMPDGGTLKVTAENVTLDEHYASMSKFASAGPYVCLTVMDSGQGMDSDVVEKVFDPFFTTKGIGEGTGLGLSTVAAILKSHEGFVNVYSEPGRGTRFKLYFPAVVEELGNEASSEPRLFRGEGQLVLVVDDEAPVREITRQTLESFGYRVVTASDGAEAVAMFGKLGDEIDVVLTDIMMPIMDGIAEIIALKHLDPSVKIIAASGLGSNGSVAKATDQGVKHFLPKPYTAEALLTALHRILNGADPET